MNASSAFLAVVGALTAYAVLGWWWMDGRDRWRLARLGGRHDWQHGVRINDYHLGLFRLAYVRGYGEDRRAEKARTRLQDRRNVRIARIARRTARRAARRNP